MNKYIVTTVVALALCFLGFAFWLFSNTFGFFGPSWVTHRVIYIDNECEDYETIYIRGVAATRFVKCAAPYVWPSPGVSAKPS